MSETEFRYWRAYDSIESIGARRDDDRLGILTAIVASAVGFNGPIDQTMVGQFVPDYDWAGKAEEKQAMDLETKFLHVMGMHNTKVEKGVAK